MRGVWAAGAALAVAMGAVSCGTSQNTAIEPLRMSCSGGGQAAPELPREAGSPGAAPAATSVSGPPVPVGPDGLAVGVFSGAPGTLDVIGQKTGELRRISLATGDLAWTAALGAGFAGARLGPVPGYAATAVYGDGRVAVVDGGGRTVVECSVTGVKPGGLVTAGEAGGDGRLPDGGQLVAGAGGAVLVSVARAIERGSRGLIGDFEQGPVERVTDQRVRVNATADGRVLLDRRAAAHAVAGKRLYVADSGTVSAFELGTGRELWSVRVPVRFADVTGGLDPSALRTDRIVTDGERVFVQGDGLAVLDPATGRVLWQARLKGRLTGVRAWGGDQVLARTEDGFALLGSGGSVWEAPQAADAVLGPVPAEGEVLGLAVGGPGAYTFDARGKTTELNVPGQVGAAAGRTAYVGGEDGVSAVDVPTGRVVWRAPLPRAGDALYGLHAAGRGVCAQVTDQPGDGTRLVCYRATED
ncbi:PQQ-binding-like beta-propeller repeat protein [Nonomuraea typhae]|uniref:PQQ-binding-like beta-propeller repeat protein n=1 Tax=Nonomuraea typhae TaxID=2603600 RepID=A0ABW7Z4Z9_9ACTN